MVVLGSFGRRIPGGANVIYIPQFRDIACLDGICQWSMDERGGILGISHDFESILEIRLPLHRLRKLDTWPLTLALPARKGGANSSSAILRFSGHDGQ